MQHAWWPEAMGKPLQIRDVPDAVLNALRMRAEHRHMSLASYALEVLAHHAQSKTMSEVLAGPRLRKGKALKNDEILELLAGGRR
jgi:plasmid stability protein